MGKCSKIRCIVRMRQMLRRWRMRAAALSSAAAPDVPAGHVAVCVGSSSRRFVVRAAHLNHPVFRQLLRQAEEEYGFPAASGPITLPCEEGLFENILRHIKSSSSSSRFANMDLLEFQKLSSSSTSSSCCCCCCTGHLGRWRGVESLPLLHGLAEKPAVW